MRAASTVRKVTNPDLQSNIPWLMVSLPEGGALKNTQIGVKYIEKVWKKCLVKNHILSDSLSISRSLACTHLLCLVVDTDIDHIAMFPKHCLQCLHRRSAIIHGTDPENLRWLWGKIRRLLHSCAGKERDAKYVVDIVL